MDHKKLKIALIKQIVLPDLYVCPTNSTIDEILFSSMMRVGPLGLFHEFNTDFIIVDIDPAEECQLWKEINQTPINGPHELLLELKNKTLNQIPGQEFKDPGSKFPNGYYAVNLNAISWDDYDIIISINISIPSHIIKKHPERLWCYMLMEPNILMDKVYFNYDVSFNHNVTGIPYYYPGIIDFPYTYLHPGLINNIFEEHLGRKSYRNKIYIDVSCSKNKSEEKLVKDIPEKLKPLKNTNFQLAYHNQNIQNNLTNIFDSKYAIKIGGSYIRGNSLIESISAGALFIGDPDLITLNTLIPKECQVKSVEEIYNLIIELEVDHDKYLELWWMQKTLAQFYVVDQPTTSLLNIFSYKRKFGPLKNNLKTKILRYSKKKFKRFLS